MWTFWRIYDKRLSTRIRGRSKNGRKFKKKIKKKKKHLSQKYITSYFCIVKIMQLCFVRFRLCSADVESFSFPRWKHDFIYTTIMRCVVYCYKRWKKICKQTLITFFFLFARPNGFNVVTTPRKFSRLTLKNQKTFEISFAYGLATVIEFPPFPTGIQ